MKEGICRYCLNVLDDARSIWICYFCDNEAVDKSDDYWPYQDHRDCFLKWRIPLPIYKCEICSRYFYKNNACNKNPTLLKDVFLEKEELYDLLEYAVDEEDLGLIETLHNNGENIHIDDDLALLASAELGKLNLVKFFVEHRAYVHAGNDNALYLSAKNGHFEVLKYLIEQAGADPHANDSSALIHSAANGRLETVKYLVEHGANIHARNDGPLKIAIQCGHLAIVKFLIENGANIHDITDHTIVSSPSSNRQEVIEYLKGVIMM